MSPASVPITCVLLLLGVGLYFAPDGMATRLHNAVSDGLRPGQIAVRQSSARVREQVVSMTASSEKSHRREVARLQEKLQAEQTRSAALTVQLARASDIQARETGLPSAMRQLPRLASPSLIEAAVMGDVLAEQWRSGRLLDRGESHGVRESSLVVNSRASLIDIGQDGELSPEDALLLGRCVIGKVERVGRWTSTFLLLTDSAYRGRAQLIHQTESGFVFGAKGILKGQGRALCRLDGISSVDSVNVGDSVFTANRDGVNAAPLYYGKVVEATLGPDAAEWKVLVEPVPLPGQLTTVQILRTTVNTERLAAGF